MVFVEGALVGADVVLGAEGLGDHHHHGVGHAAAAADEQFEEVVEGGGVAGAGLNNGDDVGDGVAEEVAGHVLFADAEAVAVAAEGVDLAVVGD